MKSRKSKVYFNIHVIFFTQSINNIVAGINSWSDGALLWKWEILYVQIVLEALIRYLNWHLVEMAEEWSALLCSVLVFCWSKSQGLVWQQENTVSAKELQYDLWHLKLSPRHCPSPMEIYFYWDTEGHRHVMHSQSGRFTLSRGSHDHCNASQKQGADGGGFVKLRCTTYLTRE